MRVAESSHGAALQGTGNAVATSPRAHARQNALELWDRRADSGGSSASSSVLLPWVGDVRGFSNRARESVWLVKACEGGSLQLSSSRGLLVPAEGLTPQEGEGRKR